MSKRIFILLSLIYFPLYLFSQGEIDDQERIFYRNERTFAGTISTNGFGGNFRYAKRQDAFRKTTYELGFDIIKHEKEYKISQNSSQQLGNSFVYGKLNSLYSVYGGIGFQRELFRKEDKGGISIRYFYNFGPVIGIQKPVYYDVIVMEDNVSVERRMKFEPHILLINNKAPFYVGFDEISIIPGGYAKFGFSFEFSKSDMVYHALEAGVSVEAFIREIPIMANDQNHWFFPAFFLSYRFGKVIDAQFINNEGPVDELLSD